MSENYHVDRTLKFVKKAVDGKLKVPDYGYRLDRPDERDDFARAMMTRFADDVNFDPSVEDTPEDITGRAILSLTSDGLTGVSERETSAEIKQLKMDGLLKRDENLYSVMMEVARTATKAYRDEEFDMAPVYKRRTREVQMETTDSVETEDVVAQKEPNYTDPIDVIKYLHEADLLEEGRAKALLLYFGLVAPAARGKDLQQVIAQVDTDLRRRINAQLRIDSRGIKDAKPELSGASKILASFITRRKQDPSLRLILNDYLLMEMVGKELVRIYGLTDTEIRVALSAPKRPGSRESTENDPS